MKHAYSLLALFILVGCSAKSPYDITPQQAAQHVTKMRSFGGPGGPITEGGPGGLDLKNLPPGAVRHEFTYKKGDKLPDGTIAPHDMKIVNVEMHRTAPKP